MMRRYSTLTQPCKATNQILCVFFCASTMAYCYLCLTLSIKHTAVCCGTITPKRRWIWYTTLSPCSELTPCFSVVIVIVEQLGVVPSYSFSRP